MYYVCRKFLQISKSWNLQIRPLVVASKMRLHLPACKEHNFSVVMYECESWMTKNAELRRTGAFELWYWRILLNWKEIQPVNSKGNQFWTFTGRTDAEAEAPILWPSDVKNWFIGKDPDVGKDWRQEEKGMTEDKMVGCHHWINGHDLEQALKVGDRQGSLACCSPWGCRVRNNWATEPNWTEVVYLN